MKHCILLFFFFLSVVSINAQEYQGNATLAEGVGIIKIEVDDSNSYNIFDRLNETDNKEIQINFSTNKKIEDGYSLLFQGENTEDTFTKINFNNGTNHFFTSEEIEVSYVSTIYGDHGTISGHNYTALIQKSAIETIIPSDNTNDRHNGRLRLELTYRKDNCAYDILENNTGKTFIKYAGASTHPILELVEKNTTGTIVNRTSFNAINCNGTKWYFVNLPVMNSGNTYEIYESGVTNALCNVTHIDRYFIADGEYYIGELTHFEPQYHYITLSPSSQNHRNAEINFDNRAPRLSVSEESKNQDIENDFVSFEITLKDTHFTPLEDGEFDNLKFYLSNTSESIFRELQHTSYELNDNGRTIQFRAPSINGSFFRGEQDLHSSLVARYTHTDLAGNSNDIEFTVQLSNAPIVIIQSGNLPEYINNSGIQLNYSYELNPPNIELNKDFSQAIIQKSDGTFVDNALIEFGESTKTFTVTIGSLNAKLSEGERFELIVRLEDTDGNSAIHTSSSVYDGTAPRFIKTQPHEGIINTNWIDLTNETIFKYKVEDFDLDLSQVVLTIVDAATETKSIKLRLHNQPEKNQNNQYQLQFLLSNDGLDGFENQDSIVVKSLELVDYAGNDSIINNDNSSGFVEKFYYEKPENISINENIIYKQGEDVIEEPITNGNLYIEVEFTGEINDDDNIAVEILDTKADVNVVVERKTDTDGDLLNTFSFEIDDINSTYFQSNTTFRFETYFKNKSNVEVIRLVEGPRIILPIDFNIEKTSDSTYVRESSTIHYTHTLANNTLIDTLSKATLSYTLGDLLIEDTLSIVKGVDEGSDFSVEIITATHDSIPEGTVMQLSINLYEASAGGREASITNNFIYDASPPIYHSFSFVGINTEEPIDRESIPQEEDTPIDSLGWIDLSSPTIFTFVVEDLLLSPSECKLKLYGIDSLTLYRYEAISNTTRLSFIIQNDYLPDDGIVTIEKLFLKDLVNNTVEFDINKYCRVEKKPPFAIDSDQITYSVNADGILVAGTQRISVPYVSSGLKSVDIRFLDTKENQIPDYTITYSNDTIHFDVRILSDYFYSGRELQYDLKVENSSSEEILLSAVKGPIIEINIPIIINQLDSLPEYVTNSKIEINYNYALSPSDGALNRDNSQAIIQKIDSTFVTNATINFGDSSSGTGSFSVVIDDDNLINSSLSEGEKFELLVRLEDNIGNTAIHTSSSVYDGIAPRFIKRQTHEGIINNNWIDLTNETIFKYKVEDYNLDSSQVVLTIVDAATETKSIKLRLHNQPEKNQNNQYELQFLLSNDSLLSIDNQGSIIVKSLELVDYAGNDAIIMVGNTGGFQETFHYKKFNDISIDKITYEQNDIEVDGTITDGKLYVEVDFTGDINNTDDSIAVEILDTKVDVDVVVERKTDTDGNLLNTFSFEIDDINSTYFQSNSIFRFETYFINKSNEKVEELIEGPRIILPIDFNIEKTSDSTYVRESSTIHYIHTLEDNSFIDYALSRATLSYILEDELIEETLTIERGGNDGSNFSVEIITDPIVSVLEGTEMQLSINLYEDSVGGREASITNNFIYDASSPDYLSFSFVGINTEGPIDRESIPQEEDTPIDSLGWIDLFSPTIFTFVVEDLVLSPSECKLKLDVMQDSLTLYRYEAISGTNKTNLSFIIQNDYLPDDGIVTIEKLFLKDLVNNTVEFNINKYCRVEKKPPFSVMDSLITYSVNSEGELVAGTQRISIPYVSSGLKSVEIRFLDTKENNIPVYDIIYSNDTIHFDVRIHSDYFYSGRDLQFDLKIENSSSEEILLSSVIGPIIVFPLPSNISVTYDNVQENKWEHTQDLAVTINSEKGIIDDDTPPLNGDTLYISDESINKVIKTISIQDVLDSTYSFTVERSLFEDEDNNIICGEKVLGFQMKNNAGWNLKTIRRVVLSDVPNVEVQNKWLIPHRSGDEFKVETNLEIDSTQVRNITYFPIHTNNINPENIYVVGDNEGGEVDLTVIVRLEDIYGAFYSDEVTFTVANTPIVIGEDWKPLYCSGERGDEIQKITINPYFSEFHQTIGSGDIRLELVDLESNTVLDSTLFSAISDEAFSYQFNPSKLHEDPEIRKKFFELRMIYADGEKEQVVGYANFETLYEPEITTQMLTTSPIVGDYNEIDIFLSEFRNRTYILSTQTEGVNVVKNEIQNRIENFSYKLTEGFSGNQIVFYLEAFSDSKSCIYKEEYIIAVNQILMDNDDNLDVKNWELNNINSGNQIIVYNSNAESISIPWNFDIGRFELNENTQNAYTTLTSPIYDFRYLESPMLKFNFDNNTTERNGVFLQIRQILGNGANTEWQTVGTDTEVWNWFNTYGLYNNSLISNENGYAWSGSAGIMEGRLSIDAYIDLEIEKTQFRLVFCYGNGDGEYFEPSQLVIRDRERNVIVESFLQANNDGHHETLNKIYESLEILGQNDHDYIHNYYLERSLSCEDPIYNRGSQWTEARRLWYGLDSYNGVNGPYSLTIDGELFDGSDLQTLNNRFKYAVLKDDPIDYTASVEDGFLTLDYEIDPLLYEANENLLWVITAGDQQNNIGVCNPINLEQTLNNQVISEIYPFVVENSEGEMTFDLRKISTLKEEEIQLQILLQKDYSLEIFSAFQLTVSLDGIVNSTEDDLKKSSMMLYPVPAKEEINISFRQYQNASYIIYNAQGSTVRKGRLESSKTTVDVHNLPSGIYIVNILKDGKTYVTKNFVK